MTFEELVCNCHGLPVLQLVKKCWADKPADRPSFSAVESALFSLNPCKRSPVDTMMDMVSSQLDARARTYADTCTQRWTCTHT